MVIGVLGARHLPDAISEAWSELQLGEPTLASPFFRPEFTSIVAAARDDVFVAVLEGDGFFPFQRGRFGTGQPVGSRLSDYHGLVARPEADLDTVALLRGCGLTTWEFEGLVAAQRTFHRFHRVRRTSPQMNVAGGYDAYLMSRRQAGSDQLDDAAKQTTRLSRRVGDVRFEPHVADPDALRQLLVWKSAQYQRTAAVDIFRFDWVRDVVRRVHATSGAAFAGLLSVLYAGSRPVAMHLGIRSASVWHSWFPAYDPAYASYSPGTVLLARMAEAAPGLGVGAIDLGKGDALYKRRFANSHVQLAAGVVRRPSPAAVATAIERLALGVLGRTPAGALTQRAATRRRLR